MVIFFAEKLKEKKQSITLPKISEMLRPLGDMAWPGLDCSGSVSSSSVVGFRHDRPPRERGAGWDSCSGSCCWGETFPALPGLAESGGGIGDLAGAAACQAQSKHGQAEGTF